MRKRRLQAAGIATVLTAGAALVTVLQTTDAYAAGEPVSAWVTTADRSKLLARQADVAFTPDSGSATTIEINPATAYQSMDGFGAAFTDSSAWLVGTRMSAGSRTTLMTNLFSPSAGIGLSMVRQPMGASDFTANGADYTYDDTCCSVADFTVDHDRAYLIPVLQQARSINPQLKIMATPWSAPAWMKTNNSLNGGQLRADMHAAYADYFVKYVQAYGGAGLPIYAVTLQNEPHHEAGYPSMRMEPAEQAALVKNQLGPKFAANGIGTKIIAWDHNWDEPQYPIDVLNDAAAKRYLAGSAFHCYAGDVGAQNTVHNAHPDRDLWFTECSGGEWATDFGANLKWNVQNLIIRTVRSWAKGVTLWNMALDQNHGPTNGGCTDCRGVVTVHSDTGAVTYNVEYYVLGHAAKFVKPGAQRIDSSSYAGDLESVAFRNPDGSIALIALNAGTGQRAFKVRSAGQSFTYTLPAGAVATYTWTPGSTPGAVVKENVYYRLTAQHSGKVLDVQHNSTANGAPIQQWDYAGGANQLWRFVALGGGYYRIVAKSTGKALDVQNTSTADGALVQQWDYTGAANQQWRVTGAGPVTIAARHSGKVLDVQARSTANGAAVQQWTAAGGTNQQWTLTEVEPAG